MTDEKNPFLKGDFLGPLLAAIVTGGLLLLQNWLRDRQARKKEERDRQDARRKNAAEVRAEWVSSFQQLLLAATSLVNARIQGVVPYQTAKDKYIEASSKMHVASARLHLVESDAFVRETAFGYGLSVEMDLDDESRIDSEETRLRHLVAGFRAIMDDLVAKDPGSRKGESPHERKARDATRNEVLRRLELGSSLPDEQKRIVLAKMRDANTRRPT